ncbi:MAG: DUF2513 domain-containing protein [Myxococcales bacterium]|nr:MAG: DUF2513 domain-containing protein [Myxococcales bacterium]
MKIDLEYLKNLLEAFESAETPVTDINELKEKGFLENEDVFLFHLQIMEDEGLVQGKPDGGLGYTRSISGGVYWSDVPLRLTSQGHQFLDSLRNKEVWNAIKTGFKEHSIGTLLTISKDLLNGFLKKKVSALIDED